MSYIYFYNFYDLESSINYSYLPFMYINKIILRVEMEVNKFTEYFSRWCPSQVTFDQL